MAEGDIVCYNSLKTALLSGTMNLANGGNTIKITIHTAYSPNIDTHTVWADVSATEYGTAANYTAGGKTLAGQAVSADLANDRALWDANSPTWTALGPLTPATPSHAIIWDDTIAGDPLICYVVLGSTATNGGDYTIEFSSAPSAILSLA